MPTVLEGLRAEREELVKEIDGLTSADDFDPGDKTFIEARDRALALDGKIKSLVEWAASRDGANAIDAMQIRGKHDAEKRENAQNRGLSIGEQFVRSDVFTNYARRGSTPRFEIEAPHLLQTRALPMDTTDWAAAITPPAPRDITPSLQPTPLLDSIPAIPWGSDVVNYITWAKVAGGAAVVAEGAVKPSAEWKPTATSQPMEVIAVWTEATRKLLESSAATRAKIDGFLVDEVRRAAEAEAAAALVAATLPTATGATLLEAIRVAVGTVQASGYAPTAVLLNPADWAKLDINVFGSTLNGPTIGQTFWGLRPISSTVQPAGTAVVGDFTRGMERYVRSSIDVFITDSHADNFTKNVFTILGETSELTVVVRPAALVEASATP